MIARIVRGGWAVFTITLVAAHAGGAELAIPPGYFSSSGGFYVQGSGPCGCLRFAPARGCAIPTDFAAARNVFAGGQSDWPTYSWYAAEVPTYSGGPTAPCPACQPDAVPAAAGERWEEVGPGLPLDGR